MRISISRALLLASLVFACDPAFASTPTEQAAASPAVKMLTEQNAKQDVALMRKALEQIHPGLYRYASRQQIDAAFAKLDAAISGPISDLALHREIALMLATIHCDHTKAEMSDALTVFRERSPTHLPLRFRFIPVSRKRSLACPVDRDLVGRQCQAIPRDQRQWFQQNLESGGSLFGRAKHTLGPRRGNARERSACVRAQDRHQICESTQH
jgi:hypothetical protein